MALPKRVMVGGAYYKGYKLTVNAGAGNYILDMTLAAKACAANGISITPDAYGAGDYFNLEHLNAAGEEFAPGEVIVLDYHMEFSVDKMFRAP